MKIKQIYILLFSIFIIIGTANAQTISKVSEIYDFEAGDEFHLWEYLSSPYGGFNNTINIFILDKWVGATGDTLFYKREYVSFKSGATSPNNPYQEYQHYTDTVVYPNPDSLINNGDIDTICYHWDSTNFNNRKINVNFTPLFPGYSYYVDGCGGPFTMYNENNTYHFLKLRYFKKGNEVWGTPEYVFINEQQKIVPEMLILPNPFNEEAIIILKGYMSEAVIVNIYNNALQNVKTICSFNESIIQLDASDFAPGMYFVISESPMGELFSVQKMIVLR